MSTVTPDTVPPTAGQVLENQSRFGQDTEDKVTEWEKLNIKKIFKKYDADKSGWLSVEEVIKMMMDLKNDVENIGKVPNVSDEEIQTMFDNWDKNKDGKISWLEFRDGCNSWQWRLLDRGEMDKRINHYFEEANRKKVQGNLKGALNIAFNALQLQGCDTKTKPIEIEKPKPEPEMKRGDVFKIPMFRNVSDKAKEIKLQTIKS